MLITSRVPNTSRVPTTWHGSNAACDVSQDMANQFYLSLNLTFVLSCSICAMRSWYKLQATQQQMAHRFKEVHLINVSCGGPSKQPRLHVVHAHWRQTAVKHDAAQQTTRTHVPHLRKIDGGPVRTAWPWFTKHLASLQRMQVSKNFRNHIIHRPFLNPEIKALLLVILKITGGHRNMLTIKGHQF